MATPNYNLPTISGNMTADVVRDMNALAEATDSAIKEAVDNIDLSAVDAKISTHLADDVNHIRSAVDTGTANAKVVTLNPAPTVYKDLMGITFKNASQNTGAVTINVNGLGAKSIVKSNGTAISSGFLRAGSIYTIRYNNTTGNFILQGEGGEYGDAVADDVRQGKTFGTGTGVQTGTLNLSQLVPSNIRKNVTIDGVVGALEGISAGPFNLKKSDQYIWAPNQSSLSPKKGQYSMIFSVGGVYRFTWSLRKDGSSTFPAATVYAQLYVNDQARGILRSYTDTGTGSGGTFVEDLTLNAGDEVSFYAWVTAAPALVGATVDSIGISMGLTQKINPA